MMNYAGLIPEFEKCFSGTTNYYGNFQPYLYRHAAHRPFGIRRRCGGHLLQAGTDCGTFFFGGGSGRCSRRSGRRHRDARHTGRLYLTPAKRGRDCRRHGTEKGEDA